MKTITKWHLEMLSAAIAAITPEQNHRAFADFLGFHARYDEETGEVIVLMAPEKYEQLVKDLDVANDAKGKKHDRYHTWKRVPICVSCIEANDAKGDK